MKDLGKFLGNFWARIDGMPGRLSFWFACQLSPRVVLFCAIRVLGHCTTGKYRGRPTPERLTLVKALRRWRDDFNVTVAGTAGKVAERPKQKVSRDPADN